MADPAAGLRTPCAKFRAERSRYGKDLSELKSGLQKYIRRGETEKALWCAGELLSFRDAPEGPKERARIATNFRHRLMIILLEDVGDVGLWGEAGAALASPDLFTPQLVHRWVTRLACATKARVCSHARAVASLQDPGAGAARELARTKYPAIYGLYEDFVLDPRAALECEPEWGEALREAIEDRSPKAVFWAHAIQTKGASRAPAGYNWGRKPAWQILDVVYRTVDPGIREATRDAARAWYKDLQNTKEAFLCWMLPLLAHVFAHPLGRNSADHYHRPEGELFTPGGPADLDAYVHDIHTQRGDKKGGLTRFAEEGCYVTNEDPIVFGPWKAFYGARKRLADAIAVSECLSAPGPAPPAPPPPAPAPADGRETDYTFLARAQITTSRGKTDVYFARPPGARRAIVVVKGPFAWRGPVDHAVKMAAWKRARGLPAASLEPKLLVPDRWPSGVPLGLRNLLPVEEPAWFLVAENLVTSPLRFCVHGATKCWPPQVVVDWGALGAHTWRPLVGWDTYTDREKLDYVLALLARYVVGIGDLADRNFMRSGGRLYSLDEDGQSAGALLPGKELRKKKAGLVRGFLEAHWDDVRSATSGWGAAGISELTRPEPLGRIGSKEGALSLFAD